MRSGAGDGISDCYETLGGSQKGAKMPSPEGIFTGFIRGEERTQGTLFPVTLGEPIPEDHLTKSIDQSEGVKVTV